MKKLIKYPDEFQEKLEKMAASRHINVNSLIVQAIDREIRESELHLQSHG